MKEKFINKDWKCWAMIFCFSFLTLLFLSPDSYLYDLYYRSDSAWFFTCGKAWMNGMVPYVDFADSKGPLLWLIYGIGYLISSHSYVGVFWLSCIFYTISYFFAFKLGRLFVTDRIAVAVLLLLPVFLFWSRYHFEVRAEDYCYTFLFVCLYCVCKVFHDLDKLRIKELVIKSYWCGFSMAAVFLIKWNIAVMIGGIAILLAYVSLKKHTFKGIVGGLCGIATVLFPFCLYFWVQGNFSSFVQEYFLNTCATMDSSQNLWQHYLVELRDLVTSFNGIFFLSLLIGMLVFCRKYKVSYLLIFSLLCFQIIVIHHAYPYYFTILLPFSIFLLIPIVDVVFSKCKIQYIVYYVGCFVFLILGTAKNIKETYTFRWANNSDRKTYYEVANMMCKIRQPKIMFYGHDTGIGVLSDALPACKYWASQNGMLPLMKEERRKALNSQKPDFIFVSKKFDKENIQSEKLHGYQLWGGHVGM